LIEKRYGHIDKHRRTAKPPLLEQKHRRHGARLDGEIEMHASHLIQMVDRVALTVMNTLVFVGLPLAAVGLFIR
jgi:hypothetical protein